MRTLCLAAVSCAVSLGARKLDQKAFEPNAKADERSSQKEEQGGVDLVAPRRSSPPAAPRNTEAQDAAAAPQPEPDATQPAADAGVDAAPLDASIEPTGVAADGGDAAATPDAEDDAGSPEPEPEPCDTQACLCETICKRGVALGCELEPPLDDCLQLCQAPVKTGCEQVTLAALRCKAEQPAANYVCDEDFLAALVLGCAMQERAATNCRLGR